MANKILDVTNVITEEERKDFRNSSYYRGKNRCTKLRQHTLDLTTEKSAAYDVSVTEKDILFQILSGDLSVDELTEDLVSEGIDDRFKAQEVTRDLRRYVHSDQRDFIIPKTRYFVVNGEKIKVRPDRIADNGNEIEAIFFRGCRPDVTMKGKKQDTGVNQSIELWLGVVYLRSIVPEGETRNLKSSYYFLRKDNDRAFGPYDADFFSKSGKNVVYLEEKCYKAGTEGTALDANFNPQLAAFLEGTECSEEDCKYCPNKVVCNYQKSPEKFETKSNESKKKAITYSELQEKVISFRNGCARVIAKAGTGKTECMTERGARMYAEGVKPETMLFVTFTDAGAAEMKERLIAKCEMRGLAISADDIPAMTFHTLGYRFVKDNYEELGFEKMPLILDTNEAKKRRVINDILEANDFFTLQNRYSALDWAVKSFDLIKEKELDPDDTESVRKLEEELSDSGMARFMGQSDIAEMLRMYKEYAEICRENCFITFADIEPLMNRILRGNREYLESLGFSHIIVDEFQDSNDAQLETIRHLMSQSCFTSLMVVGDDCQSIYGFRNTSQENILNFWEKIGTTGEDFYLTENRRSTPEILNFADSYISTFNESAEGTHMVAVRDHGFKPIVAAFWQKDDEQKFIVSQVISCHEKGGYAYEDMAVIGATKAELVSIAARLSDAGIPWITKYPMPLIENSRVQAALSLGMAFFQPESEQLYFDYLVALNDGDIFNDMSNEEIKAKVAELKAEWQKMDFCEIPYQQKLYHDKLEAIKGEDELYQYFLDLLYENEDFQSELQYILDFKKFGEKVAKKLDGNYAGVVLTTAHSSKGLEWPVVFNTISGYDNKHLHTGRNRKKETEEKRRLLYVSMTRARDILYLTGKYVAYGNQMDYTYNQFLDEIHQIAGKEFDPFKARNELNTKKMAVKKATSHQMSEEDIKKYEAMIKGGRQMTLADLKKTS